MSCKSLDFDLLALRHRLALGHPDRQDTVVEGSRDVVGLIPPQGEAGGTASAGYRTYLNGLFLLVFFGQVYVGYWTVRDDVESGDHEMHAG